MNGFVKGGLIVGGIFGLGYVAGMAMRQVQLIDDTTFDFAGYKIISASLDNVHAMINIRVGNKTSMDFTVSNQNYDVFLNGEHIAKVNNTISNIMIPGESSVIVPVYVDFNPKAAVQTSIQQFIKSGSAAKWRITGKVRVKTFGIISSNIPVDVADTVKNLF